MEKQSFGKGVGVGSSIAIIIAVICELFHNGGI